MPQTKKGPAFLWWKSTTIGSSTNFLTHHSHNNKNTYFSTLPNVLSIYISKPWVSCFKGHCNPSQGNHSHLSHFHNNILSDAHFHATISHKIVYSVSPPYIYIVCQTHNSLQHTLSRKSRVLTTVLCKKWICMLRCIGEALFSRPLQFLK